MMNGHRTAIALLLGMPSLLAAQAAPPPPTTVLSIYREALKPGKGAAHAAMETAWSWAMIQAKTQYPFVAASALTGPSEVWYLASYPTWAEYEKATDAGTAPAFAAIDTRFRPQEDQYLSDARLMVLRIRPELGYGPPADLPNMRYFSASRVSVRPGHTTAQRRSYRQTRGQPAERLEKYTSLARHKPDQS